MKKNKVDWKFWWKQVLKGVIPESVYKVARMQKKRRNHVA